MALTVVSARRARRLATVCVTACAAFPQAASAQGEGVVVDPNSPSGREYAIPLDDARRTASEENGARVQQNGAPVPAPLFGAGIATTRGTTERSSAGGKPSRRSDRRAKSGTSTSSGDSSRDGGGSRPAPLAAPYADPKGGSSLLLFAGGTALAVLLIALVLARVLRRVDKP